MTNGNNNIELNWQLKNLSATAADKSGTSAKVISANVESDLLEVIHAAIKQTVDKAVSLLDENIKDDSRYFLCEWQPQAATLKIVITDDSKSKDANCSVECLLTQSDKSMDDLSEEIRHWIQNYLTTHTGFLQYSLIAIFHASSRDKSCLL